MKKLEEQTERVSVVDRDSEMFIDLLRGYLRRPVTGIAALQG